MAKPAWREALEPDGPTRRALLRIAGVASLAAGLIHVANTPEHLNEWWGYGLFFLLASIAQLWLAVALLAMAQGESSAAEEEPTKEAWGRDARSFLTLSLPPRTALRIAIAGNAAIILLYALTRTIGIPLLGPSAGEVEALTPLGLASKFFEAAIIAALLLALRGPRAQDTPQPGGELPAPSRSYSTPRFPR